MKRLISACLAVLVLLSTVTVAFAVDTPVVAVDPTGFNIEVTVTTANLADKEVTGYIRKGADTKLYGIDVVQPSAYTQVDGKYVYTLNFVMNDTDLTGQYTVYTNCGTAVTKAFDYVSPSDKVAYYNALDAAPAGDGAGTIYSILTDAQYDAYVYKEAEYTALNSAVRALVDNEIKNWNLAATLANIGTVESNFKDWMDEVLVRAGLASSAEIKSDPLEEAAAAASFEAAVAAAAEADKLDDTYYADFTADVKAEVRSAMNPSTLTGITYDELALRFSESVVLAVYNKMDYLKLKDVYTYYVGKDVVAALDATKMAKVEASEPFRLMKLEVASVSTIDELESKLPDYVDAAYDALPQKKPSTGSGLVFGGTGTGAVADAFEQKEEEVKPSFSDLGSVSWAEPAIKELSSRGVVAGRGDGKFYPNDNVSREEFVKMIVLAFRGYDKNAVCSFADVSRDDWSYSYIASGYRLGLVTGVDSKNFEPAGIITREQMAVILNRAYEAAGKRASASTLGYADSGSISDYAKDAVAKLSNLGVMNGVGGNRFAPGENVTRAQAAKAIYETVNVAEVE